MGRELFVGSKEVAAHADLKIRSRVHLLVAAGACRRCPSLAFSVACVLSRLACSRGCCRPPARRLKGVSNRQRSASRLRSSAYAAYSHIRLHQIQRKTDRLAARPQAACRAVLHQTARFGLHVDPVKAGISRHAATLSVACC